MPRQPLSRNSESKTVDVSSTTREFHSLNLERTENGYHGIIFTIKNIKQRRIFIDRISVKVRFDNECLPGAHVFTSNNLLVPFNFGVTLPNPICSLPASKKKIDAFWNCITVCSEQIEDFKENASRKIAHLELAPRQLSIESNAMKSILVLRKGTRYADEARNEMIPYGGNEDIELYDGTGVETFHTDKEDLITVGGCRIFGGIIRYTVMDLPIFKSATLKAPTDIGFLFQ